MENIKPSSIQWDTLNTPTSIHFQDIYYSPDDAIGESLHVFIQPNNFSNFSASKLLTIAETGFGTGLNFLLCCKELKSTNRSSPLLHFISVEKHPLTKTDLKKALSSFPDLKHFSDQLVNQYPEATAGFHTLYFNNGSITLTLMLGDAAECYSQLDASVDAWFLDGFAPSKNPEMWRPELFQQMARLSHKDTTFSTFTCAGIVKRGLKSAGFEIKKVPGFGRKREKCWSDTTPESIRKETHHLKEYPLLVSFAREIRG